MSQFEKTLEQDMALILAAPLGPAQEVELVPENGETYPMRAIFEAQSVDTQPGSSHAPVMSCTPTLHIPLVDVQNAINRPLSSRDGFTISGKNYRVQRPFDDGTGFLRIKLLERGNA